LECDGKLLERPDQRGYCDGIFNHKGKSKNLMGAGYEGRVGSKEACGVETYDNSGKFFTKRSLNLSEGLTIAFGWDKGLVFPPSSWKKFLWSLNLRENWIFLLPIFSFLYMANRWYRKGRDPRSENL